MKKLSVVVFVFSLLLFTCSLFDDDSDGSKKFWAQDITSSTFYQISASLLAENELCRVWVEDGSGVTEDTARKVADEYANNVYRKMMKTFGYQINDPDLGVVNTMEIAHYLVTNQTKGAKLTILLLDIRDGYSKPGDPYVGGYFYPVDLFKNDPEYPNIKSNELDMIYLDTNPSVPGSPSSYDTLAHEMQHLMNFVSSVLFRYDGKTLYLMDTWVDEGLSAAAQWVYSGKHPEERWKYYIEDSSKLIAKGNNFYIWDNHDKESPLANLDDYATVYLFFQYLRLQSGKPSDIYFNILTSKFYDYQAVTNAESINSSHKDKWPLLLRDWHAANFTNSASGLYGYMNDPVLKDIKAPMVPAAITSLELFPGEGVYSRTETAESLPAASGNIKYAGLGSSGAVPNETTGFADGARLTYNINTETDEKKFVSETGYTTGKANTGISMPAGSGSVQIRGINNFSYSFKVDAGYFRKKGSGGVSNIEINEIFNKGGGRSINKDNSIHKFDISTVERVFVDE